MSINPVSATIPNDFAPDSTPRGRGQSSAAAEKQVEMEPRPNREIRKQQPEPVSTELAEDEVQVQRDPAGSGQIVIKYLDSKGNLILQVPSPQVLGLARAIEESFSVEAKAHAANDAEQGENHGH
jgi:uncharacterized FlaG/YvyC family protein